MRVRRITSEHIAWTTFSCSLTEHAHFQLLAGALDTYTYATVVMSTVKVLITAPKKIIQNCVLRLN